MKLISSIVYLMSFARALDVSILLDDVVIEDTRDVVNAVKSYAPLWSWLNETYLDPIALNSNGKGITIDNNNVIHFPFSMKHLKALVTEITEAISHHQLNHPRGDRRQLVAVVDDIAVGVAAVALLPEAAMVAGAMLVGMLVVGTAAMLFDGLFDAMLSITTIETGGGPEFTIRKFDIDKPPTSFPVAPINGQPPPSKKPDDDEELDPLRIYLVKFDINLANAQASHKGFAKCIQDQIKNDKVCGKGGNIFREDLYFDVLQPAQTAKAGLVFSAVSAQLNFACMGTIIKACQVPLLNFEDVTNVKRSVHVLPPFEPILTFNQYQFGSITDPLVYNRLRGVYNDRQKFVNSFASSDVMSGLGVTIYMVDSLVNEGVIETYRPGQVTALLPEKDVQNLAKTNWTDHGNMVASTIVDKNLGLVPQSNLVFCAPREYIDDDIACLQAIVEHLKSNGLKPSVFTTSVSMERSWQLQEAYYVFSNSPIQAFIAASGNSNSPVGERNHLPIKLYSFLAVGAHNEMLTRWVQKDGNKGSNYGKRVNIYGPGHQILCRTQDKFVVQDGTSFAAPLTASVAASFLAQAIAVKPDIRFKAGYIHARIMAQASRGIVEPVIKRILRKNLQAVKPMLEAVMFQEDFDVLQNAQFKINAEQDLFKQCGQSPAGVITKMRRALFGNGVKLTCSDQPQNIDYLTPDHGSGRQLNNAAFQQTVFGKEVIVGNFNSSNYKVQCAAGRFATGLYIYRKLAPDNSSTVVLVCSDVVYYFDGIMQLQRAMNGIFEQNPAVVAESLSHGFVTNKAEQQFPLTHITSNIHPTETQSYFLLKDQLSKVAAQDFTEKTVDLIKPKLAKDAYITGIEFDQLKSFGDMQMVFQGAKFYFDDFSSLTQ